MKVQEADCEEAAGEDIRQSDAADEEVGGPLAQGGGGHDHRQHQSVLQQGDGTRQETDGTDRRPLRLHQDHVALKVLPAPVSFKGKHTKWRLDLWPGISTSNCSLKKEINVYKRHSAEGGNETKIPVSVDLSWDSVDPRVVENSGSSILSHS